MDFDSGYNGAPLETVAGVAQPIVKVSNDAIINGSTLQRRSFDMERLCGRSTTKADNTTLFHVYYTAISPLYYELMPFVRALRFTNEVEVVKMLPPTWIKHVDDFNDPKFVAAHLTRSTKFIESQGIPMLCTLTDSKNRATFMQKLYDITLKKVENDRIVENNRLVVALGDKVAKLAQCHDNHSNLLTKIKETFDEITNSHTNIVDGITKLIKDM